MPDYQAKYIKYKTKYLRLKTLMQSGGADCKTPCVIAPGTKLIDAETCDKLTEKQPDYLKFAIKAVKWTEGIASLAQPSVTKECGVENKTAESKHHVVKYMKDYDINRSAIERCRDIEPDDPQGDEKCAERFESKDEWFRRKMRPEYLDKYMEKNLRPEIIVSPAECRCVIFDSEEKAKKIWIRSKTFSVKRLLNLEFIHNPGFIKTAKNAVSNAISSLESAVSSVGPLKKLTNMISIREPKADSMIVPNITLEETIDTLFSFVQGENHIPMNRLLKESNINLIVSRLSPKDYHRFHSPVSGKIIHIDDITVIDPISHIKANYYSVQPELINSKIDVYDKNRRVNVWVYNPVFGIFVICIIGATCVGSIALTLASDTEHSVDFKAMLNTNLVQGQQLGFFQFGGSTLVSIGFEPKNKPGCFNWCPRILDASNKAIESFVHVGESLGDYKNSL